MVAFLNLMETIILLFRRKIVEEREEIYVDYV